MSDADACRIKGLLADVYTVLVVLYGVSELSASVVAVLVSDVAAVLLRLCLCLLLMVANTIGR